MPHKVRVQESVTGHRAHLRTVEGSAEPADMGAEVEAFSQARRKSPYPAVNERRRKREYNRRSTAQKNRQRRERPELARKERDRAAYKTYLRANAERILAEARAKAAPSETTP